jgi:diguanylate cyclase (GGDEF)-like protein
MKFGNRRKLNPTTTFYLNLCLVISLVVVGIYLGIYLRNNRLLLDSVKQQAQSYFDLIVRVRRWNSASGGVYVEKKKGVISNQYLREMGIEPDVVTRDGRVLTLRNHALMTKEISNIFSEHNGVQFHITSLQLVNEENAPDAFERRALKKFETGETEYSAIENGAAGPLFRYMAPLLVEQSCQICHFKFNYSVGDIRGGISVSIPFKKVEKDLALNRLAIIGLSLLTLVLLLGSAFLMLNQLVSKIESAQQALREASLTDELTGLRNRRFLMSRFEEEIKRSRRDGALLGFLMMDLDHFKGINDSCGHPFGDLVLTTVAKAISEVLREYDIAARYGGEEFVVVVSVDTTQDLIELAERIRRDIELLHIQDKNACTRVTISIGAAILEDSDTSETMLKRADNALYQAKNEGRNKTIVAAQPRGAAVKPAAPHESLGSGSTERRAR